MFANLLLKILRVFRALITRKMTIDCDLIPFYFRRVPLKKLLNWIKAEVSIYFKPGKPWGMSTHLQVEPTTFCNLKCALCPLSGSMDRPVGNMDIGLFRKLIDEAGDYLFLVLLWDWGEPFLNPDIYEMIACARQKGVKVMSSTNGHLFARTEHADRVVRSGIDCLIFAIDGIIQETYELYRQGGNLETALQGIRNVVAVKRALNSKTPVVNLRFIVMKHNEHEIPKLKELAKDIGVDALTLKTLNPCSDNIYGEKGVTTIESGSNFLPAKSSYRRFRYGPDGKTLVRVKNNPCKNLWNNPTVHWNGLVCPCTYDYNEKFVFGDLKTNTFRKIWSGAPYRNIRRRFRLDWEKVNICRNCSYAYEDGACGKAVIKQAFFFNRGNV